MISLSEIRKFPAPIDAARVEIITGIQWRHQAGWVQFYYQIEPVLIKNTLHQLNTTLPLS